jgi:transcriptional activator for dhaKLM operon
MISMPPRERSRDISLVVERILRRLSSQLGYSVQVTPAVLDVLKDIPGDAISGRLKRFWDGLPRRLACGVIDLGHLPASVRYLNHLPGDNAIAPDIYSLDEVERETIVRTAQLCRGNMTMMAQALGISRTTLWRRLKHMKLTPEIIKSGLSVVSLI